MLLLLLTPAPAAPPEPSEPPISTYGTFVVPRSRHRLPTPEMPVTVTLLPRGDDDDELLELGIL